MGLCSKHRTGDEWTLPEGRFVYVRELSGGKMLFEPLEGEGALIKTEEELDVLHSTRRARRHRPHRDKKCRIQHTDDVGEISPDGPSLKDRARQFYVKKWDEAPCGTGDVALRRLISYHKPEAKRLGLDWEISASTLERAINKRGEPGRRPLRVMQDMRGRGARKRWPAAVADGLRRAVAWYYSLASRDVPDAHAWLTRFMTKVNGAGSLRHPLTWRKLPTPSKDTVERYINEAESLETLTSKHGAVEARRRYKGIERGLVADRILDLVLIDGTVVDGWCVLDDEVGVPVGRPTLTLAIDVKSRVVLGVIITYEGESLYAIMACLQQVNTGKHTIIERLPHFRELLDGIWGKPDTILVDNAWRQIGVSFQDCCEDAGINVEWAPVKNPEYKAIIERFFKTLNQILFRKMPGGVPFDPVMMRRLGLDPSKTAAITLSKLEEFIYEAIYELYQMEVHSGIGMAPLLAWRKGLQSEAREIIDDIGFLASAFGVVDDAVLTREGIRFRNMTFHDPVTTTTLLNDLSSTTPARARRKRPSSATASVKIKYNPAVISEIQVWNPKQKPTRGYVSLPNWNTKYASTTGLGFWHHDRIKEFADAENLAFQTDEERLLARDRLRAKLEATAPGLKLAAMRRQRRLLHPPVPVLKGDTVQLREGIPSISGLSKNDVAVSIAAQERADNGFPEMGPRRGGKTAARTAADTRASKKETKARTKADEIPQTPRSVSKPVAPRTDVFMVEDPDSYMADFARRMAMQNSSLNSK